MRFIADIIFGLHVLVVFVVLFGWLFPAFHYVHGVTVILVILSWIAYGRCLLTDAEFAIRRRSNPEFDTDMHSFARFYLSKVFGRYTPSPIIIKTISVFVIFISAVLFIVQELGVPIVL